jgi:hypothetical protein
LKSCVCDLKMVSHLGCLSLSIRHVLEFGELMPGAAQRQRSCVVPVTTAIEFREAHLTCELLPLTRA